MNVAAQRGNARVEILCRRLKYAHQRAQKIAGLPGAKVDILSTKSADELMLYDLLEMVNVSKVWDSTKARHQAQLQLQNQEVQERDNRQLDAKLRELEDDLKEIAVAYLGIRRVWR